MGTWLVLSTRKFFLEAGINIDILVISYPAAAKKAGKNSAATILEVGINISRGRCAEVPAAFDTWD